jgi:hypothetical protein
VERRREERRGAVQIDLGMGRRETGLGRLKGKLRRGTARN